MLSASPPELALCRKIPAGRARPQHNRSPDIHRAGSGPGPRPDPRPHPAQGQPGRGRPRLDRPGDRHRAGGPPHHRGPGAPAVRRRGLDAAVDRKAPDRQYRRKLDGQQEAHLVALACSAPPEGRKRWTLRLLAKRLVELELVESVSYETVRQALQQTASSRG
ncbi:MAG TPA: helix-turn-helix domain-containing protein [Roseiflexaceae bacterium]